MKLPGRARGGKKGGRRSEGDVRRALNETNTK